MKHKLLCAVIMVVSIVVAVIIAKTPESIIAFAVGLFLVGGIQTVNYIIPGDDASQKIEDLDKEGLFSSFCDTPLEKLTFHSVSLPKDNLAECVDKIIRHAGQILSFQGQVNNTVDEIVKAYKGYIDEYIKKAISIIEKHTEAKQYLSSYNPDELLREIQALEISVQDQPENKTTLEEKRKSLSEYKEMESSLAKNIRDLQEIEATLQSLGIAIASARTNSTSEQDFRSELQRVLSSTGEAIRETLK